MTAPHRETDERLAWLAAKDYCAAQSQSHSPLFWAWFVVAVILSVGRAASSRRRGISQNMIDYSVAVDDVARQLTPADRTTLRAASTLPAWFYPAIDARFREIRKQRNSADDY